MKRLIFDRTTRDIIERTSKGFYNLEDIQRVNSYIKYLSDYLKLELSIKEDYQLGNIITEEAMQQIIDNINSIRAAWYVAQDTPETPIVSGYNFNAANDVEKILQHLYDFAISVQTDFKYSGTFNAGQEVIL